MEIEEKARAVVEDCVAGNSGWNIRLYRTFAGLRGLVTHDVFDPKATSTLDLLRRLESDPMHVQLCQVQECFRARLTPKPWRCGHDRNSVRFPIEDPKQAEDFERWKAGYESCQREYATCRVLADVGSGVIHPEVERVMELHDFATRARQPLPLA